MIVIADSHLITNNTEDFIILDNSFTTDTGTDLVAAGIDYTSTFN